ATTEASTRDLFLFDSDNQQVLEGRKRIWRDAPLTPLIWALVAAGCMLWLAVARREATFAMGWRFVTLCTLAFFTLGLVKIAVHRYRLLPCGLPIRAVAECVSRDRAVD